MADQTSNSNQQAALLNASPPIQI